MMLDSKIALEIETCESKVTLESKMAFESNMTLEAR
jgi:hypothetical protein